MSVISHSFKPTKKNEGERKHKVGWQRETKRPLVGKWAHVGANPYLDLECHLADTQIDILRQICFHIRTGERPACSVVPDQCSLPSTSSTKSLTNTDCDKNKNLLCRRRRVSWCVVLRHLAWSRAGVCCCPEVLGFVWAWSCRCCLCSRCNCACCFGLCCSAK